MKHNRSYTGDGGVDGIVVFSDKTQWAIQAKRYDGYINSIHVHHLLGAVNKFKMTGGIFIHTGKTGKAAYQCLGQKILLISGKNLHKFITHALGND